MLPRVKNVSRLASHPPVTTSSSSSVPQPEMVIIQVNNASRSWAGNAAAAAAVDDDEYTDSPTATITYESFYGNPRLDFHCLLRKEADVGSDTTPTTEKATTSASEEQLDRAKGSPGTRLLRPPPPLLAPKPKLNCRARRASGGSSSLYSEKTVFAGCDAFDWNSGQRSQFDAKRLTSSSGGGELFARPTSAVGLSSTAQGAPSSRAHGGKMMSVTKTTVPPPPPPKRINSVKGESLSSSSSSASLDSEHVVAAAPAAEETHRLPSSPRHVKVAGRWETTVSTASTELSTFVDSDAKSQCPEIASPTDEVSAAAAPIKQKVCVAASPDFSTLPFANENIGTIRQKPSGRFPHLTKVLDEAKPPGALGRDGKRHIRHVSENTPKTDTGMFVL